MSDLNIYLAGLRGQLTEAASAGEAFAEKLRRALAPYTKGRTLVVTYETNLGAAIFVKFSSAPAGSPSLDVLNSTHRLQIHIYNPRGGHNDKWDDALPDTLRMEVSKLSYKGKLKPRQIKAGSPDKIFRALVNWFKKNGPAMVEEDAHHAALGFMDEADTSFWTADKAQNPKSAEDVVAAADKAPGELLGFQVHGKWFNIKRKSRTSYFLSASRGTRARWGTRKEILQDVKNVLKYGSLPHAQGSGW